MGNMTLATSLLVHTRVYDNNNNNTTTTRQQHDNHKSIIRRPTLLVPHENETHKNESDDDDDAKLQHSKNKSRFLSNYSFDPPIAGSSIASFNPYFFGPNGLSSRRFSRNRCI